MSRVGAVLAKIQAERNHFGPVGMMLQGEVAGQLDGLPTKFFDFLLLLVYSLLSLLL